MKYLLILLLLIPTVYATTTQVWQGQHYIGTTFQTGYALFNFTIYDNKTNGNTCYTNTTILNRGVFGEWKTEKNIGSNCNNATKDYFLEIRINNELQDDINGNTRMRLTIYDYLRRDTTDTISQDIIITGTIHGHSPLKIDDFITFVNKTREPQFSIYHASSELPETNVSTALYDTLILETNTPNQNNIEACFWNKYTQTLTLCINTKKIGYATTITENIQTAINKTDNENYTKCEGQQYIDCNGGDILANGDIESKENIYAQKNITAQTFNGNWNESTNYLKTTDQRYNETNYCNQNFYNKTSNINTNGYNITTNNINATTATFDSIKTKYISMEYTSTNISHGNITYTAIYMGVLGEGGIADNLDNINGGTEGDIINILPTSGASDITLKHGTGNLNLNGVDCTLKALGTKAELRREDGT